jgi:ABC-type uncharacterized transport system substrate-binding protein
MHKHWALSVCVLVVSLISNLAFAESHAGKKMLYIDSYHAGYAWSDGILSGIQLGLEGTGIDLKVIRMDTKRNPSEDFAKQAALESKTEIDDFGPDVVIASDDAASKYLIMPYYKDADLPFVFCGVNWDASEYGFPCKNVTGMVEVSSIDELVNYMGRISEGSTIGFLTEDKLTDHKNAYHYKKTFGIEMTEAYAADFEDWKQKYLDLQKKADMLIIGNTAGLPGWNLQAAVDFVLANGKIPSGTDQIDWMPFTLIGFTKVAEEQGVWASRTALKILDGTSPSAIPVARNQDGRLLINLKLAEKMGLQIPYELLQSAHQLIQ